MRKDKELAFELRRQGQSYKQISRQLGVSTGTLGGWFGSLPWSIEIKNKLAEASSFSSPQKLKLLSTINKKRWETKRENYRQDAVIQFPLLKDDPLFLSGLMLYWGEGDKIVKYARIRLANSDPKMIKLFYHFLRRIRIPQEKIRMWLLLYPDLIDSVQKNFWSKITGFPIEQFSKSIFIKGRHPKRRLSYGVCNIEVYSRELKEKMLKWLELYQNNLLANSY